MRPPLARVTVDSGMVHGDRYDVWPPSSPLDLPSSLLLLCRAPRLTMQTPSRPRVGTTFLVTSWPPEVAARVLTHDDADRRCRRKEKSRALAQKPFGLASCYGCGAPMQMVEEAALGYDACCKRIF